MIDPGTNPSAGVTLDVSVSSIAAPLPLSSLLQGLPAEAQPFLGWIPDIQVDSVGLTMQVPDPGFAFYITAGEADSANASADVFAGSVDTGGEPVFVVGLGLDSAINLGVVPLFGSALSGITLQNLALSYASADIPAGGLVLPQPAGAIGPFAQGPALGFTLGAAGASQAFSLTPAGFAPATGTLALPGTPSNGTPVTTWFPIQKTIGPLSLNQIGTVTGNGTFGLALDAGVATPALSVVLDGLTLTFPTQSISLSGISVGLEGLSVSLQTGSFSLAGGLVKNVTATDTEYDGAVLMQIGSYGITALGSFADMNGSPSLFVYGVVQGQIGGPPAFFITGVAAGFGYNRSLTLPTASQVASFPLVQAAQNPSAIPTGGGVSQALATIASGGWIPPSIGSYWVAAGIQFTSFGIVDSFALLTAQFGSSLVFALLGTSTVQLPTPEDSDETYTYAELLLDAVLEPDAGTFQAMGLLTPNSYVLDPACQLTGGFAASAWFGSNEHAGDFVATIGGYNPNFTPPAWYPNVPRLGFNWPMSSEIDVQGDAYFAVTPSCAMAGGALSMTYQSGPLAAWFTAYADFIVFWRPFYFVAGIGLSIGASYTLNLLVTHKTFTVSLSADLSLWGPPIAGVAEVSWWVFSFTVNINGGGQPSPPGAVLSDWSSFATTFLPPPSPPSTTNMAADADPTVQATTTICGARAASGLAGTFTSTTNGVTETWWSISADSFQLSTQTIIPATAIVIAGPDASSTMTFDGPEVGVYPLGSMSVTSTHTVTLTISGSSTPLDLSGWTWTPLPSGAPGSLWSTVNTGEAELGSTVLSSLGGVTGVPDAPPTTGPGQLDVSCLTDPLPSRPLTLPQGAAVNASSSATGDPFTVIETTIMDSTVVAQRAALVAVLNTAGIGTNLTAGDLSLLASDIATTFENEPMLGALGTTGPATTSLASVALRAAVQPRVTSPQQPAPPVSLHAALRRSEMGATAHVLDRFASAADRRAANSVLAPATGLHARMTVRPGSTLLWNVAPEARFDVIGDGRMPLRITSLDAQDVVLDDVTLANGKARSYTVPAKTRRLAIGAAHGAESRTVSGWRGSSHLLQLAPHAFLGDDAVVRPQAPPRIRHRRGTRDAGVVTGRALVRGNRTQGRGTVQGWIETLLPAAVRTIVIPLLADRAPAPAVAVADALSVAAVRGSARVPLLPVAVEGGAHVYSVPPGDEPLRVTVRTANGWLQDGLLGFTTGQYDLDAALAGASVSTAANYRQSTKVAFR